MNSKKLAQVGLFSLIALSMVTRLMPHAPNFTAVGAAAIFGGFFFSKTYKAILVPMVALFLSDLLINNVMYAEFYDSFMWFTPGAAYMYGAFFLSIFLGKLQQGSMNVGRLVGSGVVSAVLFFLITNIPAWLSMPIYTKDFSGLLMAYTAGLPFLLNQLAGNLVYGAILFGSAYYVLGLKKTQLVKA